MPVLSWNTTPTPEETSPQLPPKDQIIIGIIVAASCALGWLRQEMLLQQTGHGARLVRWFGPERSVWVLRFLLGAGVLFGILLATNVIHPLHW
ncbi:MAG TPA: hypothetical protein VHB77_05965 [Planctomycetaceae bacterium]|nr:hypothetical protein [Planctomycetaceae bacterium]